MKTNLQIIDTKVHSILSHKPNLPGERIFGFISLPRILVMCVMQIALFRFWTWAGESISYNGNCLTMNASLKISRLISKIIAIRNFCCLYRIGTQQLKNCSLVRSLGFFAIPIQILDEAVDIYFVLIPVEKAWTHLFSSKLWVNSRTDCSLALVRQPVKKKENWIQTSFTSLENWPCVEFS